MIGRHGPRRFSSHQSWGQVLSSVPPSLRLPMVRAPTLAPRLIGLRVLQLLHHKLQNSRRSVGDAETSHGVMQVGTMPPSLPGHPGTETPSSTLLGWLSTALAGTRLPLSPTTRWEPRARGLRSSAHGSKQTATTFCTSLKTSPPGQELARLGANVWRHPRGARHGPCQRDARLRAHILVRSSFALAL